MKDYCHRHNLVEPERADAEKKFGIKVSLPGSDPFNSLLGEEWQRVRWYTTETERDEAFEEMAKRHLYSRHTDMASQVLEKITR